MKRSTILVSIFLAGACVQPAGAAPLHHAKARHAQTSACLARQRADLAPLDRYGGVLPASAPPLMQAIMNPYIANMRVHCMPENPNAPEVWWHDGSATISP